MSGLEVLGALSGAVQLAEVAFEIVKLLSILCSKLHDAPASIAKRAAQIQHLVAITQLIQQNPTLQTTIINSLLTNCLDKANELREIIAKATASLDAGKIERYWKAFSAAIKESRISELCQSIEEEKSALILCIASVDSSVLRSIDTELVVVHGAVDEIRGELPTIRETARGLTELLDQVALLKGTTVSLQTELGSILEKVTELAAIDQRSSKPAASSYDVDEGSIRNAKVQTILPALREALSRLAINDPEMDLEHKVPIKTALSANRMDSTGDLTKAIASLGAIDQRSFLIERLSQNELACKWFLDAPKIKLWLAQRNARVELLYITARAGCGKTTIIAHTIRYIESNLKLIPVNRMGKPTPKLDMEPILLYFFFHRANPEEEGTAIGAIKTLVFQLALQVPNGSSILLKQYEVLSAKPSFLWSWDHLWGIFIDILRTLPGSHIVYMILDGLDECESQSRWSFLARLEAHMKSLNSEVNVDTAYYLKVMISGRPDEQVIDAISSVNHFEITIEDTASDMDALIDWRIAQFAARRALDCDTVQKLSTFLRRRAEGMFLWVILVMEELERRDERLSDDVIAMKLERVPVTLVSTYKAILRYPPVSRQSDLWHVLRWLMYAKRVLTIPELEGALCAELGISKWHDFIGDLNFLCGSVIRLENNTVSLIHQTFRDFLQTQVSQWPLEATASIRMRPSEADADLAMVCLKVLESTIILADMRKELDRGLLPNIRDVDSYLRTYPFFTYAAEFWSSHLQIPESLVIYTTDLLASLVRIFDSNLNRDMLMRLDYFFRHSRHPKHARWGRKIQVASYFRLPSLIEYYLSRDEIVSTALIWASETGSMGCTEKLLRAGADPNLVEYDGWSALHWAGANGHGQVCQRLIQAGANKDVKDDRGFTPRDMAVQMGHNEVAKQYFGGIEGAKPWRPTPASPDASIIGARHALRLVRD